MKYQAKFGFSWDPTGEVKSFQTSVEELLREYVTINSK